MKSIEKDVVAAAGEVYASMKASESVSEALVRTSAKIKQMQNALDAAQARLDVFMSAYADNDLSKGEAVSIIDDMERDVYRLSLDAITEMALVVDLKTASINEGSNKQNCDNDLYDALDQLLKCFRGE